MKIAVYAISKNEEQFVKRFCESAKDADLILIADTGSTDGTCAAAVECGATVRGIHISPWRFDHARTAALALIPPDIDVCISLDLDEVMEPYWRQEIERVWIPGETTRLRYGFDWGCGIVFQYEKIHARNGYHWHHPCHEYPVPDARITERYAHTDKLLVRHLPDPTKSRGQYLDLLKLSVTEDPECPRNAFYYARELTFHRRWEDATAALVKYLAMPKATWPNERCYAMRLLGQCWEELGGREEALRWYRRAVAEAPNTREPWCDLSMLAYRSCDWMECYSSAMKALAIKDRQLVYTCDPKVWGALPHDLAGIAAWNLGMNEEAVRHMKDALAHAPEDPRLKRNLELADPYGNRVEE
jgi:glycosyltransferase involved in cell wall biosynthesis